MKLRNEDGFHDTRKSVLLRAILLYDNLSELAEEGIIQFSATGHSNVCRVLTILAIREANKLDDYFRDEVVNCLIDEPVTSSEVSQIILKPLRSYLSVELNGTDHCSPTRTG